MARNERFLIAIVIIISFIIGGLMGYILDTQVLQKFPENTMTNSTTAGICGCIFLQKDGISAGSTLRNKPGSPNPDMCYFQ